jgi:hypothetical protein
MAQSKRQYENLIIMNSHDFYDYEYYNLIQSNDERRSTSEDRESGFGQAPGTS